MQLKTAMRITTIIGYVLLMPGLVSADVFKAKASDSAVKMIHFPQSLAIIWNRPDPAVGKFDLILGDPAILKRTLRKIDPARIAPAKLGDDLKGPMTREVLAVLGRKHNVDLLLVFRRDIVDERANFIKLRNRARIYVVRQKKLLVVPANDTVTNFNNNNRQLKIREINEQGLQQLSKDARKVIMSYKFEKRRSNY